MLALPPLWDLRTTPERAAGSDRSPSDCAGRKPLRCRVLPTRTQATLDASRCRQAMAFSKRLGTVRAPSPAHGIAGRNCRWITRAAKTVVTAQASAAAPSQVMMARGRTAWQLQNSSSGGSVRSRSRRSAMALCEAAKARRGVTGHGATTSPSFCDRKAIGWPHVRRTGVKYTAQWLRPTAQWLRPTSTSRTRMQMLTTLKVTKAPGIRRCFATALAAADSASQRSLSVGMLGPPNVGKVRTPSLSERHSKRRANCHSTTCHCATPQSTLLNALLGQKVSITSSKAQTTRREVLGVHTHLNTQLVCLHFTLPAYLPARQASSAASEKHSASQLFYDTPGILHPAHVRRRYAQLQRNARRAVASTYTCCNLLVPPACRVRWRRLDWIPPLM